MTDLLTLIFTAKTAIEAEQLARIWAAAEPGIRLERLTRVRPLEDGKWLVEIAYRAKADDQQRLGL